MRGARSDELHLPPLVGRGVDHVPRGAFVDMSVRGECWDCCLTNRLTWYELERVPPHAVQNDMR